MFSPRHRVADVAEFLGKRLGEVSGVAPIGSGEWSQAFSFATGEQEYVIRLGSFPEDYAKDRVAPRFAAPDLPIPRMTEMGEALGGCYAITERAYGSGFDGLDGAGYRQVLPSLLRCMDALRRADVSDGSGYGMWRPDGAAPFATWREFLLDVENDHASSRVHGWRRRLATVPAAVERFGRGYRALQELVEACPEQRHLIHADLMGDNVLVGGERVTAVVDWGNAMYGDWLHDLARITFFAPWFPELERIDLREQARAHYRSIGLEVPDFEARLRCCEVHIGLDAQAYNAFTRRWDELERSGLRTLELAGLAA